MAALSAAFERAADLVKASPRSVGTSDYGGMHAFSDEEELQLYGAYKQATIGDVKGPKPAFFDIAARSKWQAWAFMRGKTKDEAKAIYVDIVDQSLRRAAFDRPELFAIADQITGNQLISTTSEATQDMEEKPLPLTPPSPPPRPESSSSFETAHTTIPSSQNDRSDTRPYGFHPIRKGSTSHSIVSTATGLQSAAASVYELASDQLSEAPAVVDGNEDKQDGQTGRRDELGLDQGDEKGRQEESNMHSEYDDDDDDEVYQSSEEYGDEAEIAAEHEAARMAEEQLDRELERNAAMANATANLADTIDSAVLPSLTSRPISSPSPPPLRDDLIDEGVFDEEDKIEEEAAQMQDQDVTVEDMEDPEVATLLHSHDVPEAVVLDVTDNEADDEEEGALDIYDPRSANETKSSGLPNVIGTKSRTSSISSSGYGGSVTSKTLSPRFESSPKDELWPLSSKADTVLSSPVASEPFIVRTMTEGITTSPGSRPLPSPSTQDKRQEDKPWPSSIQTPASASSQPSSPTSFHPKGAVCPVTKKTTADGMCPATMFAMARQGRPEGEENSSSSSSSHSATATTTTTTPAMPHLPGITRTPSPPLSPSASDPGNVGNNHTITTTTATSQVHTLHPGRSRTQPPSQSAPTSSSSSSSTPSPSMRLGQGIVSRISALRSSLAAASARAASSALSSSSSSNVSRATAVDPVTQQTVTVICPHGHQTNVLERELEQVQNEVTALTERLRLLQESLEIKSQTQRLEKRSARGILKMFLRQGIINAVLLLVVFAILYKRRSPIAFAILAYVGQGRKESEAGWRALMHWFTQMARVGRRNQRYVLSAGRRNGYW